jgi:hypothetical protein
MQRISDQAPVSPRRHHRIVGTAEFNTPIPDVITDACSVVLDYVATTHP